MRSVGEMLTEQILRDDITVEQARHAFLSYHRRPPRVAPDTLEAIERRAIIEAMERHDENASAVIRELDISKATLYRKLKIYGHGSNANG